MYKFKLYSKLYDKAKARHDREDDYAIADIAAETPEKYGKYAGMALGVGAGILAGKAVGKVGKRISKLAPKLSDKINKVVPEDIKQNALGMMGALPMMNIGGDLGAKVAGKGVRNAILEEAEDRRRNPEKYQTEEERNKLIGNIKSPNLKFNKKKK